jgi:hypothetical protein
MDAMNQTSQKRQHQRWMLAKMHAATVRDRNIKTPEQVYEITRQAKEDQLSAVIRITQAWGTNETISAILCDVPASKSQRRLFNKASVRTDAPVIADTKSYTEKLWPMGAVWSCPRLTEQEQKEQDEYSELHNLPF